VPAPPTFPPPGTLSARILNRAFSLHVVLYRLSRGRIGGRMQQLPILLLQHVGRRTGERRTTPVLYLQHGKDRVIVASRGGSDAPPAWWLNLHANPHVTVEIRGRRSAAVAREATAKEQERLWPELVRGYSHYTLYAQRTSRHIPVIILTPAETEDGPTRSACRTVFAARDEPETQTGLSAPVHLESSVLAEEGQSCEVAV